MFLYLFFIFLDHMLKTSWDYKRTVEKEKFISWLANVKRVTSQNLNFYQIDQPINSKIFLQNVGFKLKLPNLHGRRRWAAFVQGLLQDVLQGMHLQVAKT